MKAIILAAGSGIKASKNNEPIPTCLMKIAGKTLLERQISILKKYSINDILVVVGKEGECWTKENILKIKKIASKVIVNPLNARTPSSSSLILGLEFFRPSPCLIIDGDLVFEEGIIREVMKSKHRRLILLEETRENIKGTYMTLEEDRIIKIERAKKSGKIYTGLMKIDKMLYNKLKEEIKGEKDKTIEYPVILNKYLDKYEITALDVDNIPGDPGDLLNFRPMVGGSFANTRIISRVIKKTVNVVRKEAVNIGREKLIDEIKWLKSIPLDLAPYFPNIIEYDLKKKKVWYEMEYYNVPTFRSLIISKRINQEEAIHIIKALINFLFSKMYPKRRTKTNGDYAEKVHIQRIKDRLIYSAQHSPIIHQILSSKNIVINGKSFFNLPILLKMFERDESLLKKLEPPFLCMVHGDLHFDNFTVDISRMPQVHFTFLDPRGLDNTYNYDYDLAKIWFSLHGKYDMTHEGLFDLEYKFKEGNFVANIKYNDEELFNFFNFLYYKTQEYLKNFPQLKKDPNWELRTIFGEISHYCSNIPFLLKGNKKEKLAIALYLRGVKLANEFAVKYCKDYDKYKPGKNYININSIKEYNLAKRFFEDV